MESYEVLILWCSLSHRSRVAHKWARPLPQERKAQLHAYVTVTNLHRRLRCDSKCYQSLPAST